MALKPALYGLELEEAEALAVSLGEKPYRGRQILPWLYRHHVLSLDEAHNLPGAFREKLNRWGTVCALEPAGSAPAADRKSEKFIFRTGERDLVESVLILTPTRRTVCVSTQLGCKIGCTFCASGKGKFVRHLTAGEIVEQVTGIERLTGKPVTNVVFMGMGEPLDNFDQTMKALRILQEPWGLGIGARHITVSTSGLAPRILDFVRRSEGRVRLSVSLHSSREDTRSQLVPINRKYPIAELRKTLGEVVRQLRRDITFEYTLIAGVNDSPEEAEGVAKLCRDLNAKVNLIPCNPIAGENYRAPSPSVIARFRQILHVRGVRATLRQTEGQDINAACGQLRLQRLPSQAS
jgi:23S rRNA (adenine2503-C2)-methyltransferase